MCPGAQHKVDNLVTEIFRVTDTSRFLNLLQLRIQRFTIEQLTGIGIAILLILNPEVGVGHVAIEDVLTILGIGFQVSGLNLFANELGVFRDQITFQVLQVFFRLVLRELLTFNLLLQHVKQVHRVGRHFGMVKVEDARQDLKGKTGRQTVHPFIHASVVMILLPRFGFRIGIFQAFAVINPHFGVDA